MAVFTGMLGFVGSLLLIGLAVVGLMGLIALAVEDDSRRRERERSRRAEARIADIGRQAQAAILGEALRRVYGRASHGEPPEDRPGR